MNPIINAYRQKYMQYQVGMEMYRRRLMRDDSDYGAVSTETAVITAVLVAVAVAAGTILIQKGESNANNIPDTVDP